VEQVGPRLKQLRSRRGVTLSALWEPTGISKSTLSRPETGQRRASLECLPPLAQAYRVPLDDLVGAPEVGDPRIRLKASKVCGRIVLPLTRSPGPGAGLEDHRPGHEQRRTCSSQVARRERVAVRPFRPDASCPRRPESRPRRRRGNRVRHACAALVREHLRPAGRDPQYVRTARRMGARPGEVGFEESCRGMRMA
jgi:transcriptional regulator with XRE-family HTH domain